MITPLRDQDPNDGYRSSLDEVKLVPETGLIFFDTPIEFVEVQEDEPIYGYRLVDQRGHMWLRFETDAYDDYYPFFVFDYTPPHV